jgi:hypothetical protein
MILIDSAGHSPRGAGDDVHTPFIAARVQLRLTAIRCTAGSHRCAAKGSPPRRPQSLGCRKVASHSQQAPHLPLAPPPTQAASGMRAADRKGSSNVSQAPWPNKRWQRQQLCRSVGAP